MEKIDCPIICENCIHCQGKALLNKKYGLILCSETKKILEHLNQK